MPQIEQQAESRTNGPRIVWLVVGGAAALVAFVFLLAQALAWQAYNSVMSKADKLDASKDYVTEEKLLEDYAAGKPAGGYRYDALVRLGALDYKMHRYSEAFLAYEQARGIGGKPDAKLLLGIATAAEASGNKATAAAAYEDLTKVTPEKQAGLINQYQDRARFLEGR